MSREEISSLAGHYRTGTSNISKDFFVPCLRNCSKYRRAVGYFSSTVLIQWGEALPRLIEDHDVSIELIASPQLSTNDIAALRSVVDDEEKHNILDKKIESLIQASLDMVSDDKRLALFCWMVATGKLEIKFAFPKHIDAPGIFHEKIGVFDFSWGDQIAFTGSANETLSGYERNYESVDVYRSWLESDAERVQVKLSQFSEAWNEVAAGLEVVSLSGESLNRIKEIAPDERPSTQVREAVLEPPKDYGAPSIWVHQEKATKAFLAGKKGILEMATGTGKTRTAIKIISALFEQRLIDSVIVCTEGTDLLDQWSAEILSHIDSLGELSGEQILLYRHYEKFHELSDYSLSPVSGIIAISRGQLSKLFKVLQEAQRKKTLIVHDEVHGFGTQSMRENLLLNHVGFEYRLGLSATPDREYDQEGNKFIEGEIGPVLFSFDVEDAIKKGILCEFNYIPILYELTEHDKERLHQVYAKKAARAKNGNPMSKEEVWTDLAKVYKTAENKPIQFKKFLFQNGADNLRRTIIFVETKEYGQPILEIIHPYTHEYRTYYAEDERYLLVEFAKGNISCLVTCHRVSQGIDIKSLENIILFSSAKARLETIQRIGRTLRTDPNNLSKKASVIDFIRVDEETGERASTDNERFEWLSRLSKVRREV